MLFLLNNVSFSFFLFFFPLVAAVMLFDRGEGRHRGTNAPGLAPSLCPCRQTRPAQTDLSACPSSNLLPGAAPNRIHLSLPQFPIYFGLPPSCQTFWRALEGHPSSLCSLISSSMEFGSIPGGDITSTKHSPPEEQSSALLFPFSLGIRQQNPLKSWSLRERHTPAV